MFNPLIPDLSKIKNDELEKKIQELMKKYLIASRSGQGIVCNQIINWLDAYKSEQQKRHEENNKKMLQKTKDYDDLINIE